MVDREIIILKAGLVKKHLERVKDKLEKDVSSFLSSVDSQDIVSFNLQMAIQNCIDIGAHVVSEEAGAVPGSVNEIFFILHEKGFLPRELTEKMVKAAGFRNLLIHEYGKLDLEQVFQIAQQDAKDLNEFLLAVFSKVGLSDE